MISQRDVNTVNTGLTFTLFCRKLKTELHSTAYGKHYLGFVWFVGVNSTFSIKAILCHRSMKYISFKAGGKHMATEKKTEKNPHKQSLPSGLCGGLLTTIKVSSEESF